MVEHSRRCSFGVAIIIALFYCPLTACNQYHDDTNDQGPYEHEEQISDGTYVTIEAGGYAPDDQAKIMAVTVEMNRSTSTMIFSLADGTKLPVTFQSRDKDDWEKDCYLEGNYALNEVADLSPVPLVIESLVFNTALIVAACNTNVMVLLSDLDRNGNYPYIKLMRIP